MKNEEIIEALKVVLPLYEMLKDKKYVKFDNPNIQLKALENLYYHITKRKYLKFDSGCSACVRESLTIINNWVKKNPEYIQKNEEEGELPTKVIEPQAEPIESPIEITETKKEVKKGVKNVSKRRK